MLRAEHSLACDRALVNRAVLSATHQHRFPLRLSHDIHNTFYPAQYVAIFRQRARAGSKALSVMSQKRKRSVETTDSSNLFRSEPIEDRSSTFIGYFSPTLKPKELQQLEEFADASHRILGWRRESNQQAITGDTKYISGSDDDGEKYGGKKVEKVLESMQVIGACVVARWYGGVLLGPVRYTHIENAAKEAVQSWRGSEAENEKKRRKAEEDENEKPKLIKTLARRDESISVLRQLAMEKEEELKKAESSQAVQPGGQHANEKKAPVNATETKSSMDYSSMPIDRLRALEKARDATLSFLLKRIDKAEAELAARTTAESELEPP